MSLHNNETKKNQDEFLQYAISVFDRLCRTNNFNRVAKECKPISATHDMLTVELLVGDEHVNSKGTLHGGQTSALVDIVTATAVGISNRDRGMVSVEMSVSYLLPVSRGDTVTIEARVLKAGRSLAFTEADFRRRTDGALVAKGRQTLAFTSSRPPHAIDGDAKVVS